MIFRPLRAPIAIPRLEDLEYPLLMSPKIDGIRGVTFGGKVHSSTMKLHTNLQVQRDFGDVEGLDGELTYGSPTGPDVMNRASSAVRARDVEGDFQFYLFDWVLDPEMPYYRRLEMLHEAIDGYPQYSTLQQVEANSPEEARAIEEGFILEGYEGAMMRNPMAPYKHNRATFRDRIIWKLKRFHDEELLCVDLEHAWANENAQTVNAMGLQERSYSIGNKTPKEEVGTYICTDGFREHRIAPGMMTHEQRAEHWATRSVVGEMLTVRHFGTTPAGELRFARVIAIREDI